LPDDEPDDEPDDDPDDPDEAEDGDEFDDELPAELDDVESFAAELLALSLLPEPAGDESFASFESFELRLDESLEPLLPPFSARLSLR
jgi:hypothetical protein